MIRSPQTPLVLCESRVAFSHYKSHTECALVLCLWRSATEIEVPKNNFRFHLFCDYCQSPASIAIFVFQPIVPSPFPCNEPMHYGKYCARCPVSRVFRLPSDCVVNIDIGALVVYEIFSCVSCVCFCNSVFREVVGKQTDCFCLKTFLLNFDYFPSLLSSETQRNRKIRTFASTLQVVESDWCV